MAASCVLVTDPSLSMPLLIPRSIDSSEGEGISGGFYCGENELILPPSSSSSSSRRQEEVWSSQGVDALRPPPCPRPPSHVSSSLRCLHPRAWRWRSSGPSSGQNAGVSTAAPFLLRLSFPTCLHLCLYLSLLLKMLRLCYLRGQPGGRTRGGKRGVGGEERKERR